MLTGHSLGSAGQVAEAVNHWRHSGQQKRTCCSGEGFAVDAPHMMVATPLAAVVASHNQHATGNVA